MIPSHMYQMTHRVTSTNPKPAASLHDTVVFLPVGRVGARVLIDEIAVDATKLTLNALLLTNL